MSAASDKPLVLLSNDDGYLAPGIRALRDVLLARGGYEVWLVAPERERSAVSQAISLHKPLRVQAWEDKAYWCSGTPADSIYLALVHLLPRQPAVVLSGINRGINIGEDVLYSGTVAAAIEATLHGIPALALSLDVDRGEDYHSAASVAARILDDVVTRGLPQRTFLNVNLPGDISPRAGFEVTRQGHRVFERQVTEHMDPRGRPYYWIGGPRLAYQEAPGSDAAALAAGKTSVTPIQLDWTHHHWLAELEGWGSRTEKHDEEGVP